MKGQTMLSADAGPASVAPLFSRLRAASVRVAIRAVVLALILAAWQVIVKPPYTPASDFGYALGVAGGSLLLALLLYPLRKRIRWLAPAGPLKHWFRFHMFAGVLAPTLILFHSTFRVGSFNAAIALSCMFLVVASGIVGRFLYRRIHHGLYGSRATLDGLRHDIEQKMTNLQPDLVKLPAVAPKVVAFVALALHAPATLSGSIGHFLSIGWRRFASARQIRRTIATCIDPAGADVSATATLRSLAQTIDDMLKVAQRAAQFSAYERLFSLWHIVHVPFLCMLLITAIVHVVAVHAY